MSYTRHFSKDFRIPLDIRVSSPSYSTDQNGNVHVSDGRLYVDFNGRTHSYSIGGHGSSASYDLSGTETVDVDIEVDTEPFDNSVSDCNRHVNLLTGSVAATETAQVHSIDENSKKVATTIITGFFKNVQADISGRIMELSQRVDSRLMHLREQAKTLIAKKEQMENDYQRTRNRYSKIFEDLNKELENRVKALDEPIFKMAAVVENESERMINADFAEIASVIAKENAALSAQISAAVTKKRAKQAISQAVDFLRIQKQTDMAISRNTINGLKSDNGIFYLPVCYFEANENHGTVKHDCTFDKEYLPDSVTEKVNDAILINPDAEMTMHAIDRDNIEKYFKAEVQQFYQSQSSAHGDRVANTINKLFFE